MAADTAGKVANDLTNGDGEDLVKEESVDSEDAVPATPPNPKTDTAALPAAVTTTPALTTSSPIDKTTPSLPIDKTTQGILPGSENHAFNPVLPETLPQPSGNALPANRKRKQPNDFTPSGPGTSNSPSSPSKIGVKFEDGVVPGEGREGEKTMTKKEEAKSRNVIERTVWTFIMIGGFISTSLENCTKSKLTAQPCSVWDIPT